jgi:hypothetical protein
MPFDVAVWVQRSPGGTIIRVDADLVTDEGARLLAAAFNCNHHRWQRAPKEADRPTLTVHTG